jgi:uncharacterized protein YbcI
MSMSDLTRYGQETATAAHREERGRTLLDLSNAVVRVHKEFYGKGPTKARAHLTHDLVTVVLEGGFTRSEETLLAHGHDSEVLQARAAMQESVQAQLTSEVERITGRRVRSFMSANDPVGGVTAEIFVLEPLAHDEDPRDLGERARRAREEHRELLDEHRALRAEQAQSRQALRPDRHFEP